MKVTRGKQQSPVKGLVYGVAGIGKTTFASQWPNPIFIDVEAGSGRMDVDRVTPGTYPEVKAVLSELAKDVQGYQTIVIDSADRLESMIIQDICRGADIKSIEQYEKGYGKGWSHLVEIWGRLLDFLDRMRLEKQVHILFVGHSRTRRYEPADDSGYDRYVPAMYEKSADLLKSWSDLTLFVRYDVVSQLENGRNKACGNAPRVMYSQFHPCWDAKNRFGLPAKMPFDFRQIAGVFQTEAPKAAESPAPPATSPAPNPTPAPFPAPNPTPDPAVAPATAPEPTPAPAVAPSQDPAPRRVFKTTEEAEENLSALHDLENLLRQTEGVTREDVQRQLEKRGIVPAGTPLENYNTATLNRIINGWTAICHNVRLAKTA